MPMPTEVLEVKDFELAHEWGLSESDFYSQCNLDHNIIDEAKAPPFKSMQISARSCQKLLLEKAFVLFSCLCWPFVTRTFVRANCKHEPNVTAFWFACQPYRKFERCEADIMLTSENLNTCVQVTLCHRTDWQKLPPHSILVEQKALLKTLPFLWGASLDV